jgi:5-methylcytosine-specific restriction endonuclease McrA
MQFIEFKMGSKFSEADTPPVAEPSLAIPAEAKRDVPLRLRLKVLERDNFTCVLCGKTPALVPGTVLHIDHIVPFSKGGKTIAANLRTLCSLCNLGRGSCAELAAAG